MPNSRKNRVKLLDIAQASGVSLTAVSLALSNKPGISQDTRARVVEMARSMGYRFKAPVATTPVKTIKTVGLLVKSSMGDQPQSNAFYSHVIAGVETTCRQLGINLMFANLPVDGENYPLEIPPLVEKGEVDGLLLAGMLVDENLGRMLNRRGCPVTLVDSYSSGGTEFRGASSGVSSPRYLFNAVISDNIMGAYQATEHLIRSGHRDIAFIGAHDGAYPSFRDRRIGYRGALEKHQLGPACFADCSIQRNEVASAVMRLIEKHPQVTGLVCVNDETAIAAMYALIESGRRIPQDISVIGFDDIYLAESVVPSLTTMRVNKQGMGRLAVQLLLNQVFQTDGGFVTSIFRPTLVERNSTLNRIDRLELGSTIAAA